MAVLELPLKVIALFAEALISWRTSFGKMHSKSSQQRQQFFLLVQNC